MLDPFYNGAPPAQPSPTRQPDGIPFEVEVRFAKKRDLYAMLDYWTDRWQRCERSGDVASAERADRYHEVIFEEIDRRDAIAAEKDRRRQAKMQDAAAQFRAEMGAGS